MKIRALKTSIISFYMADIRLKDVFIYINLLIYFKIKIILG